MLTIYYIVYQLITIVSNIVHLLFLIIYNEDNLTAVKQNIRNTIQRSN